MTQVAEATNSENSSHSHSNPRLEQLAERLHHAAHWLPAQGPITAFVHHNTLHALEDQPFAAAVLEAMRIFGCEPYLAEDRYRQLLSQGRIQTQDVANVLMEDLGDRADELMGYLGTRFHLRLAMLEHPLRVVSHASLRWLVAETDALDRFRPEVSGRIRQRVIASTRRWITRDFRNASSRFDDVLAGPISGLFDQFHARSMDRWTDETWESFSLHLFWHLCHSAMSRQPLPPYPTSHLVRHRDWLLEVTDVDADLQVNDFLIPFCAAFLDQGFSPWTLPNRELGFFRCFVQLYSQPGLVNGRWLQGLAAELTRIQQRKMTLWDSILESLEQLGVSPEEEEPFVTQTLLALRGWAGMLWQTETRGDRVVHPVPEETLAGFLAVRLILDRLSLAATAEDELGYRGNLSELRQSLRHQLPTHDTTAVEQRTFLLFQVAQVLGWKPEDLFTLTDAQWTHLIEEIESFPSLERRRIYHLAYERRYRNQTLDAIAIQSNRHPEITRRRGQAFLPAGHATASSGQEQAPDFQVVCCIDDREESFRRHLEEIAPNCETFGAAGFFAVAMYYRGVADAHFQPLCPAIIRPQHYVAEDVAYPLQLSHRLKAETRRVLGTASRRVHLGSRTITGGVLTALFGTLASFPLVARVLFPRLTSQVRQIFGQIVQPPAITQLQIERLAPEPGPEAGHLGFSLEEMTATVERLLRDLGLTSQFARLVIILGHGSSSMNNPHSAAYDCGACGGGRGGPNSRAFAQMANDPRVRERLKARGIVLNYDVVFIGGFHNTGDDSVTYFDLDRLPVTHRADFEAAKQSIDAARERNAHERCRRFQSASLSLSPEAALRHVEERTADLSQTRPECGHATNAICMVGRRARTRGLFMDRRSFLTSYDPLQDDEQSTILTRLLQAAIPVCAGINLEYYFSYVDPAGWGCGTKLPHNVTSLLGVMDGAASDLRTGLPWQMVEIHEPVRLLFVIETTPEAMDAILTKNPGLGQLCRGEWVQLAVLDPHSSQIHLLREGRFEPYFPETQELPVVENSMDWYRGWREALGFSEVRASQTRRPVVAQGANPVSTVASMVASMAASKEVRS